MTPLLDPSFDIERKFSSINRLIHVPTRAGIKTPKVVEQILKTEKAVQVIDSVRCSCVGLSLSTLNGNGYVKSK